MVIRTVPEPTCPKCGGKMKLRRPRQGQNWRPFWSCAIWPDCEGKRQIQDDGRPEMDDEEEAGEFWNERKPT